MTEPVTQLNGVAHRYDAGVALHPTTLDIPGGCIVGLIGPDGVGKSTLLGLIAGVRRVQDGVVIVLGGSIADAKHREALRPRIAYMPQGLGRNLYSTLSAFVEQTGATFPILQGDRSYFDYADPDGAISPFPLDVIVDRDGTIRYLRHEFDGDAMAAEIERLLAQ